MFLASSEPFTSCLVFWETNGKGKKKIQNPFLHFWMLVCVNRENLTVLGEPVVGGGPAEEACALPWFWLWFCSCRGPGGKVLFL